jgi:hypothetical protein
MPLPTNASASGGRLTGGELSNYFHKFYEEFLKDRVLFNKHVSNIQRNEPAAHSLRWSISVEDTKDGSKEVLRFAAVVLCTGVRTSPALTTSAYASPGMPRSLRTCDSVSVSSTKCRLYRPSIPFSAICCQAERIARQRRQPIGCTNCRNWRWKVGSRVCPHLYLLHV